MRVVKIGLLVICFFACSLGVSAQIWPPAGMLGTGDSISPWEINTPEHLNALADYVNTGNGNSTNGICYKLTNDIDLSGYNWVSIGYNDDPHIFSSTFQGYFDGNNKTVKNLTINRPMEVLLGLFGFIYSASIENLGVEDCNIVGFGVLGGLVGVSLNNSTIANCYVTGSVSGNDKFIGGLVGRNYNSTISNSYAVVNVSGEESTGGLAGYSGRFGGDTTSKSIISNCYVAGSVSGGMGIGGLVGENGWTIVSNSYATCNVSGEEYVGGLLGVNFANSSISNCIATNESVISSVNTSMINRIAGFNEDGSICNNNYALSTMVVQNGSGTVNITNGLNTIAGMEKDVNILQSLLFYTTTGNWYNNTTWDITSSTAVWDICEGKTLPWLRWQKIDCNKIGIAEVVEMINIKIFPNPAQSQFTVTNTENADIQLFNALGQEVFHTYSKEESTVVEVGSLPQGVYMLKVVQKDGSFSVHKVVKR